MVVNAVLVRGLLFGIVFITILLSENDAKRGGYLNFQFLCFKNPGHFDFQGNTCGSILNIRCDPFFIICISYKQINGESAINCPVYYYETKVYYDTESVCNMPYENRGILQNISPIELLYPLQEEYYVRIVVKDYNKYSAHQYIAVFSSVYRGLPSQNFNDFVNTEILMTRAENQYKNPKASLKISMGLKCDYNLYGSLCVRFCKGIPTDNYICSPNGAKTCKLGWIGTNCMRRDECLTFPCAKGASCVYIKQSPKCMCKGVIGPQCYPNFNPCLRNPCMNRGTCILENMDSSDISCICQAPYHGSRCNLKFDLCQLYPCKNNGTCIINKNEVRICKCPPSFSGTLCDQLILTTMKYNRSLIPRNMTELSSLKREQVIIIFGVLFGILFFVCLIIIFFVGCLFLIRVRKKKIIQKINVFNMKDLNRIPSTIPNSYIQVKEETIYDTIDDRDTYVYQKDSNDDYLVPSRPRTPVQTPGNVSETSDYAPMCSAQNSVIDNEITIINTIENEYLPSLPTRSLSKKHFQLFNKFKF